jgi:hypothetical protein
METEIFLARRLDEANQLEIAREIRLFAQASKRYLVAWISTAACGITRVIE